MRDMLRLPDTLCGVKIKTDFHLWLKVGAALTTNKLLDKEKEQACIALVFGRRKVPAQAFEQIAWFYATGEAMRAEESAGERILDWQSDAAKIWADIRMYAGIDLARAHMHWWEFYALVRSLPEGSQIMTAVGLRALNLGTITDSKQRAYYAQKKRAVQLDAEDYDVDIFELMDRMG